MHISCRCTRRVVAHGLRLLWIWKGGCEGSVSEHFALCVSGVLAVDFPDAIYLPRFGLVYPSRYLLGCSFCCTPCGLLLTFSVSGSCFLLTVLRVIGELLRARVSVSSFFTHVRLFISFWTFHFCGFLFRLDVRVGLGALLGAESGSFLLIARAVPLLHHPSQ